MSFLELVKQTRSTRRFKKDYNIPYNTLIDLIKMANMCPSALNRQPMKYIICKNPKINNIITDNVIWAPYIKDFKPSVGQRPNTYLIMVLDKKIVSRAEIDAGIQAQTIMLGASSYGYSGCIMEKFNKPQLTSLFALSDDYEILLLLALGMSDEKIIVDEMKDDDIKFYHDQDGNHHVPKRNYQDLILKEYID